MFEPLTPPPARRLVTVFGGTGFLGRRIVRHLLEHNFHVRAVSRHPDETESLSKSDHAGLTVMKGDVRDPAAIVSSLAGAYGAVNAVSLYVERGRDTFDAVHVAAAARFARLAREADVERLVHISGIGADPASSSSYIRARGRGEQVVQHAFPNATLIRPSVMFGPRRCLPHNSGEVSSASPGLSDVRQGRYEAATGVCRRCRGGDHSLNGARRRRSRSLLRIRRSAGLCL